MVERSSDEHTSIEHNFDETLNTYPNLSAIYIK